MRRLRAPLVLAFALACGSKPKTAPEQPTSAPQPIAAEPAAPAEVARPPLPTGKIAPPESILGVAILGDLAAESAQLGQFMNAVQPGSGGFMTVDTMASGIANIAGMPRLEGADLTKPVRIVLLSPSPSVPFAAAVLVAVKDGAALRNAARQAGVGLWAQKGYAVIGSAAAVDVAGPWALTTAIADPVPDKLTVTLFGPAFHAILKRESEKLRSVPPGQPKPQQAAMMMAYIDAGLTMTAQTRELSLGLEANATAATLHLRFVPREGTTFATFAGQQRASDYALLGRLSELDAPIVAAGRLDMAPIRDAFLALQKAIWESTYGPWNENAQKSYDAWFEVMTGEIAGVAHLDRGLRLRMLWGVSDPKKAADAVKLMQVWSTGAGMTGPMKMTSKSKPGALRYKGATFDETTFSIDMKSLPEDRRPLMEKLYGSTIKVYMGVVDKLGAVVMGKDAAADTKKMVDTLKKSAGKTPASLAPATIDAALKDSRSRNESLLILVDAALMAAQMAQAPPKGPPPKASGSMMAIGVGADPAAMRVRITIPVPQVQALKLLSRVEDPPANRRGAAQASRRP